MKRISYIAAALGACLTMGSCSSFFEEDSTYVIKAEDDHLNSAADTVYSVLGILNKVQALADRTVLLGEARGDLMTVTEATSADLRAVASFSIDDNNKYNSPRDYYAVINNCNYYIAKADTALKNNRGENLFKAEYAAVKAIRAWTYLQLVTTYGKVPFVTEPILTKEASEMNYPSMDIQGVCEYFLDEDGLNALVEQPYPYYGEIKSQESRKFFVPMKLVLGDMALWAGRYMDAAKYYYGYLSMRDGVAVSTPTTLDAVEFTNSRFIGSMSNLSYVNGSAAGNLSTAEVISYIPMDSVRSEGYYSELRDIFNTSEENDYQASLVPAEPLFNISRSQTYCYYDERTNRVQKVPNPLIVEGENASGDLRLTATWRSSENAVNSKGERYTAQNILKYNTRFGGVRTYRRTLVYLRLAEALNRAGYPDVAATILTTGINRTTIQTATSETNIAPNGERLYSESDSAMLVSTFNFAPTQYEIYNPLIIQNGNNLQRGLHSRGCGYVPGFLNFFEDEDEARQQNSDNNYYSRLYNFSVTDNTSAEEYKAAFTEHLEDIIMEEEALELAFEGYRYYDLLRVALRRGDDSYLYDKISLRGGVDGNLRDRNSWFLNWGGKIGPHL